MKRNLLTSVLMTVVTTVLLGLAYPLLVTGLAQLFFRDKANGQIISAKEEEIGSRIIGQPFVGPGYFHSRPSAAGAGYDAANSGGTNLGPTNQKLVDRVKRDVSSLQPEANGRAIPVDMVTSSASGLDPHITPANAAFQLARVARERGMSEAQLREIVFRHTEGRQLGFLGEPRVNVLEMNLELDRLKPLSSRGAH